MVKVHGFREQDIAFCIRGIMNAFRCPDLEVGLWFKAD